MARSFSTTIINALNAAQTDQAAYVLLAVSHSTFATQYFVNNTENVTSNGQAYTAAPFEVQLPPDSEDQRPIMRVVAANITRTLIDEIRTLAGTRERMKATVSIVLSGDPDTVLASFPDFDVVNAVYTARFLTFDLTIESALTEAFPFHSQTPNTVPGIF